MTGFAEEVKQATGKGKGAPEAMLSGAPDVVEAKAEELPNPAPKHGEVHPELVAISKKEEAPTPQPKSGKIRIGTEVFEDPQDAILYAEELQRQILQKDAYEMGKKDSQSPKEEAPAKDFFDEIEESFYDKPKEVARKLYEKAKQDAKTEIETARVQEETRRRTWEGFYSQNQDLVENKDLVEFVLQKNFSDIGNLPAEKALKILAEKTRSLIGSRKESTLPTKELPSVAAVSTSSSGASTATGGKKEEGPLDFISQLQKHRKRT